MRRLIHRRTVSLGVLVLLFSVPATGAFGQNEVISDSVAAVDSVSALESTRMLLRIRDFVAANEAAERAAAEIGLSPASSYLTLPDTLPSEAASVLLYRGLSLELQRMFPEAAADYRGFLTLESDSPRAAELRERLPYVQVQAVRTLARRFRDDADAPATEEFSDGARFSIGVFPLLNESSLLAMSQMAFGLTGLLSNAVSLLDVFSDRDLATVPYAHVRWLLDEILPQEVYLDTESVPASELARILDTDYLVFGRLDEVVGSLSANLLVGQAASEQHITLSEIQSSYSQAGLQELQLDLALTLADSIQAATGFEYVPSREAFADSLRHYLITDVDAFLSYGYAIEQLLIGDVTEGQVMLLGSGIPLSARDLLQMPGMTAGNVPPADNLISLTSTTEELAITIARQAAIDDSLATAAAVADSLTKVQTTAVTRPPGPTRSRRTAREVIVVSAAASRVLGQDGVGMPQLNVFATPGKIVEDPREGKSGTLDPTRQRAGVPIRVTVPIPRNVPENNSSRK